MKKLLSITLLAMMLHFGVSGQESVSVFLNQDYEQTDSADASIIRTIVYTEGRYILTDLTINGQMLHYGTYVSFDPWIEHGLTKHYTGPDVLYSYGNYEQGKLSGQWVYLIENKRDTVDYDDFYKHITAAGDCGTRLEEMKEEKKDDDRRIKVVNALRDFMYQDMILPARTLDRSPEFLVYIDFIMDPSGMITCPVVSGTDDEDLTVELMRLIHRFRYSGKISRPFKVRFSLINKSINPMPDSEGDIIFTVVEDSPSFPGDFEKYIRDNLVYPEEARKKGIYGSVFVNFVVEPDGSISHVNTPRMEDPLLNQEAIRLLEASPRWNPGRQRGEAVRVRVNVIVPFKLSRR